MAAICSCNVYCKYLTWYLIFINTGQVLTVLRDLTCFVPFLFSLVMAAKTFFLVASFVRCKIKLLNHVSFV